MSIYLDPTHPDHTVKSASLDALPTEIPRFVSCVALAELGFGVEIAHQIGKKDMSVLTSMIATAHSYAVLDVTHHTAIVYAKIKAALAKKFLAKILRKDRPKYLEEWVDKSSGKALAIDENDLWMCSQAKERDLIFVTADKRMRRITEADPEVRLLFI
nr:PIN domain-containing protein [Cohaesibacter sp. ES.047]